MQGKGKSRTLQGFPCELAIRHERSGHGRTEAPSQFDAHVMNESRNSRARYSGEGDGTAAPEMLFMAFICFCSTSIES